MSGEAPRSLEDGARDLIELLRNGGTTDADGNPIIPVSEEIQDAINYLDDCLDDPLRALLRREVGS